MAEDISGVNCAVVNRHIAAILQEAEHRFGLAPSEDAGWWTIEQLHRIGDVHGVTIRVMDGKIVYQKTVKS